MIPILLGIGLIVITGIVISNRRSRSAATTPGKRYNPFSAVELIPGRGSCADAKRLAGLRMLASEAPALPLDGCTRNCNCAFKRSSDRRQINRRRCDDGLPADFIYVGEEKRSDAKRRAS